MVDYRPGDIAFTLFSMAVVWLMIPGIGYFYSGLAREKNALSLIMCSVLSIVVVSVQWFLWGYSLCFSKTANSPFLGNLDYAFLRNVLDEPSLGSSQIPDILFCAFQGMFAALTPALAIGSAAERGRILPMIFFIFIWSTLVYDVVVYAAWGANGWSGKLLGALDFAGGTPVHITSGFSSLAYALVLGKRQDHRNVKPHHMSNVVLGTALLWFGWFGFNGGSALAGNTRAAMACLVTNLSACVGAITWMCLDYCILRRKKFSALGFCSGAVAGLVAITPGSGFIGPAPSVVVGFIGSVCCYIAVQMKHHMSYDDSMDVFSVHGVGGFIGSILTGVFAEPYIAALDGTTKIAGGWLSRNWIQVPIQLAEASAGAAWSFVITYIILSIMNRIPGLSLRVDQQVEIDGLDATEIGEVAYFTVDKVIGVDVATGQQTVVAQEVKSLEGESVHTMTTSSPHTLNNP